MSHDVGVAAHADEEAAEIVFEVGLSIMRVEGLGGRGGSSLAGRVSLWARAVAVAWWAPGFREREWRWRRG